jgi:ArsR family transcriptional regulator
LTVFGRVVYSTIRIYQYSQPSQATSSSEEGIVLESMRRFKAGIFQALSHPTRVAIVEFLSHGEMSVGRLCEKVGVEQANASQHLAVLRNKHIVETRKEGNQIFYRLRDPLLGEVLAKMRDYFQHYMAEATQMLKEEQRAAKKIKLEARK